MKTAKTVKVLLHLGSDGSAWAAGLVTSEWQGAVRVDRRLSASHPMPDVPSFPAGVDRDVYRAWLALGEVIRQQVERG